MNTLNVDFTEVMERVSIIMETELGVVPYDKNIANELGLSPTQFANNKKRNKIPYFEIARFCDCLLYTSPSPRDGLKSRMPSSA